MKCKKCEKENCYYNENGMCAIENPDIDKDGKCDDYITYEDFYEDVFGTHDESEVEYGPNNPWDAPGMSIHDFL